MEVDASMPADLVLPGQHLGTVGTVLPGQGTYIRGNGIFSSLFGFKAIAQPAEEDGETADDDDQPKVVPYSCSDL
jgi:hypothetical protein